MVPRDRFLLRLSLTIACLAHSLTAWSYSQAVDCNEAALLAGIAQANSNGGGTITFNCQNQTILLGQGLGEFQGNLVLDGENRNITIEYFPSGLFAGCVPGNNGIFGPAIAELTGGNNVVRNLTFKNFLESLQISGPNNTIEDNTFLAHQCSDDGLSTIDVAAVGTLIQRNLLQDYEDKAFQMSFGGGTVTDNTFIDTKQPIRAPFDNSAGDTFFVTDNLFTTTPGNSGLCDGVRITGTYHIVFERNTHSFCKRGVRLGELGGVGGLEAEVRDNIINDNQQAGIRVGGDARVSLSGNTIEDNGSVPGSLPEGGVVVWENAEADLGGGSLMIGGQPLSSIGQNTLTGNNVVDVRNLRAGFTVRAENNCWDNSTLGDVLAQDVEGTVAVDPIAVSCGAATTTTTSTTTSTTTTTTSSTTTTTIPTTTSTTTTSSSSTTSTSSTSTSSTSSTTSTTLGEGVDNDSDGVDDDVESNAPNGGDGNQDGMPDSQQGNVVSLPNAVDNRYVTLVVGESNGITGVSASDLSPPGTPVGVDFPIGFLDFTTDSETVEIVVPQGVIVNSWWKFGPTLENDTAHLYEFPVFDGTLGTEILNDQDRILLHFVDGQRGDDDLQVNGTITDLGGPAFAVPAAVPGALAGGIAAFEDTFVGLAIVNPNEAPTPITLSVADAAGNSVDSIDLQEALDREPLAGGGQTAFLRREVLGSLSDSVALIARGQDGPVQSFFLIGDNGQTRLDGVAGEFQASERLYFSSVREGAGETTLLFVFNPGNQTASQVRFSLYNPQGQLIRETQRTIAPNGFVLETVEELFRSIEELVVLEGYVEVDAEVPLTGFEFLEGLQSFYALSAQVAEKAGRLLAPQFFADTNGGTTQIRILNLEGPEKGPAQVTVRLFNDSGVLREETVVFVGSGELFIADAAQLLGLDPNDPAQAPLGLITGYLDMELKITGPTEEAPLALGTVTFLANQGESQAVLPMIQDGQTSSSFLQVAESDAVRFFTGLAILNAGQEDAQITVRALGVDGAQTAEVQLGLEAGNRVVDRLSGASFFGSEFVQLGGHLEVESDLPVVTFALFGDLDSGQLSAVEGQATAP